MKCKACGAILKDDSLYFCIGCGAMLKNPITGDEITENREEFPAEENILPEKEDNEETAVEAVIQNEIEGEKSEAEEESEVKQEEIPGIDEEEKTADITENEPIADAGNETEISGEKTAIPEKTSGARLFGAALIAIVSGILLIALSLLFSVKLGVSPNGLKKSVENMNIWYILTSEIDGKTISDHIYEITDFEKASHGFADKTEFTTYMAKTDLMDHSASIIWEYAAYILNGKGMETMTVNENEITDFFIKNGEFAKETFGYEMQMADYNSIRKSLSENEIAEKLSTDRIGWNIRFRLENIRYILSYITLGILTALVIVLLVWIAIAVNRKGKYLLSIYGNVFFWSGIFVIAAGAAITGGAAMAYVLMSSLWSYVAASTLLPTAVYGVCIGLIETVAGVILKKIRRAIKVKEKILSAK